MPGRTSQAHKGKQKKMVGVHRPDASGNRTQRRKWEREMEKEEKKLVQEKKKLLKKKTQSMGKKMNNRQRKAQAKKEKPHRPVVQLKEEFAKNKTIQTKSGEQKTGTPLRGDEFQEDEELVMFPEQISPDFNGIVVATTNKTIIESIESWKKEKHPRYRIVSSNSVPDDNPDFPPHWVGVQEMKWDGEVCLENIKKDLTKYGRQGLVDLDVSSQEWQDWCDDVACFYTLRYVLTEEPIPICPKSVFQDFPDGHFQE